MAADSMAIHFGPKDFDYTTPKIYGRISANAGLLKSLLAYSKRHAMAAYVDQPEDFKLFQKLFSQYTPANKTTTPIYTGDVIALSQSQLCFRSDPLISQMAWARKFISPTAFSLCGLIHCVSALGMINEVSKYLLAPLRPWDALICTSRAAKQVVETLIQQWSDHLAAEQQAQLNVKLQLPVIPLGIHTEDVVYPSKTPAWREQFRRKWRIQENDFVVLFLGRLFFYDKAHPIPMFIALNEIAKRMEHNGKVHFIQAGWFDNPEDANAFKAAAKMFCPQVNHILILLKTITDEMKYQVFSAADVFISLSDNIQETFGLTLLEAMANKLPVVVSDWDGYRDTVRHGIDGFRVPTIMPPAGCGVDIGLGFLTGAINYHTYCGLNAQKTAVDIKACIAALWQLQQSPALRQQMGEAGYKRVHDQYHWRHIITQYDALWDEQAQMRLSAQQPTTLSTYFPPMIADPYATFASYPSIILSPQHQCVLGQTTLPSLQSLHKNVMGKFGWQQRLSLELMEKMIQQISVNTSQSVQQLVDYIATVDPTISSGIVVRSLAFLIKFNFLQLQD